MILFDRALVRRHRDRAADAFDGHDFLFREVAERLVDRLDDVRRDFPEVLDLGCHTGYLASLLQQRRGTLRVVTGDLSPSMTKRAAGQCGKPPSVAMDEEFLPFKERSFDLVLSCLSLHWVNDLPGALVQIRRCLKPGGLFLGAVLGGETLKELYRAFLLAEAEMEDGASPRISPFTEIRDAGQLLQRTGFIEPVSDSDTITTTYPNAFHLLTDLRNMGETNALYARRRNFTPRRTFLRMAEAYESDFPDAGGRLPATFQIIYLTGWVANETPATS
ncbi:MAG: methyltransferase domain-containing protein [Alphaproteobacteria bacterium]|nr:methyltransferase domain-containing protein [Alphaproteobacteria bacterium]